MAEELTIMLEASKLHIAYKGLEAVHGVSFRVDQGELVSIVGANGAGKTSILNSLMGLVKPAHGQIIFQGRDISSMPAHQRARAGIRAVMERAAIFPLLSVYENIMTGLYGLKKDQGVVNRLDWLYTLFPILKERLDQQANTLSGGEQQQLSIARALISNPKVLLVDEISMGLSPLLVDRVFAVLQQLNVEQGLTILLVEQNALASMKISNRTYVLESGAVAFEGEPEELMADSRVKEAYIGM